MNTSIQCANPNPIRESSFDVDSLAKPEVLSSKNGVCDCFD